MSEIHTEYNLDSENTAYDIALKQEQIELRKLDHNKDKLTCTKCNSIRVGIFPNCLHTYGCSDCGNVFVKKPKGKRHG